MRYYFKKLNIIFLTLIPITIIIFLIEFHLIKFDFLKRSTYERRVYFERNSPVCEMPKIDFNDKISMNYLEENYDKISETFKSCDNESNYDNINVVSIKYLNDNKSLIQLNKQILYEMDSLGAKCFLQQFDKEINQSESNPLRLFEDIKIFDENYAIELNEFGFFYIYCLNLKDNNSKIYDNVITVFPKNMRKLITERLKYKKNVFDFKNNLNISIFDRRFYDNDLIKCCKKIDIADNVVEKMNVLIFGLDSLSFNHFRRVFPLTFNYLNSEFGNENIIYEKFNSVGQSTHPNIVALLTGIIDNKLFNLTTEIETYRQLDSTYHDHLPFIWNSYEDLGYVTMYQEDAPDITLFNSKKKGFRYWPTSFYTYPFWKKYYEIRSGPNKCHFKIPTYMTWLKQIENFIKQSKSSDKKVPYFSFSFLTEYTHDDLAIPSGLDIQLKNLLVNLHKNGYLDDTLLIILSDHGNRLQKYSYATSNGRTERYLPFLSIKLPAKLIGTSFHRKALSNKNKLVTLFDVHQTLRHFLLMNTFNLENFKDPFCKTQFNKNSIYQRNLRGISLFHKIPYNRSCSDALISEEFCNCYKKAEIPEKIFTIETNHTFKSASLLATNFINNLTSHIRFQCEPFKILEIVSLKKTIFNNRNIYSEILVLEPGNAWFEVTFKMNENILTLNDVPIRLSAYGSQAKCIKNDSFLPSYCFCKT